MNSIIKDRLEKIEKGIVPDGYKKTKVGIIPEDWEVKKLGEILKVKHGKNQKEVEIKDGKYPILGTGGIIGKTNHYLYNKESVLIGRKGTIDKPYYMKEPFWTIDTLFYTEVNQKTSDVKYIYYKFNTINWYRYNAASGVPSLSAGTIESINIQLPPLHEQEEIAHILSTWDRAIENIEKLIQEKEIQKKGLMQELLTGKTRLAGFTGDWEEVKLGEVTERVTEKNEGKTSNVMTISADYGLVNQEEYFTKQIASTNLDNYTYLKNGEFAYNKSYSKGYPMGAIKMLELYEDGVVSSLYICFKAKNTIDAKYLQKYFDANMFNHEIFKVAQEGARNHGLLNIGIKDFFNIKLLVPPLPEQEAIAEILSTADQEIDLLKELLEEKKEEKKGLMQLLLTGVVRVREV